MIVYTLQVNKPSAYSLQSRSSQRQFLCILYSVGNESGSPFRHPTGRLWEKGMGHTAQAIMLSLSVPNDSYTAHLLSELWEIQGVFWWCPNSHSMFAAALQRQIRRTARREVNIVIWGLASLVCLQVVEMHEFYTYFAESLLTQTFTSSV